MTYEWRAGDGIEIEASDRPTRFADTSAALIVSAFSRLLLVNPHPTTWNNWQFPYVSHTGAVDNPVASASDMEIWFDQNRSNALDGLAADSVAGLEELLGVELPMKWATVLATFALRHSKTADQWTLYRFQYYSTESLLRENLSTDLIHDWLSLGADVIRAVAASGMWDGLPVSENVITVLSEPSIVRSLRETV